jgi:RNA polymerase sigma-70 factor (ECF subfamily)
VSGTETGSPISREQAALRFGELYRDHYPKVLGYARRRTATPDDADEIVSATFLVAWRRLDDYLGADVPLAWLYGVTYRTLLSHRRSRAKSVQLSERITFAHSPIDDRTEPAAEAREELAVVMAALTRLPRLDQELLLLAGWEEQTHSELAAALDIPRQLVRARLYRARQRLQRACDQIRNTSETGHG